MRKTVRLIALLLAVLMITTALAGCTGNDSTAKETQSTAEGTADEGGQKLKKYPAEPIKIGLVTYDTTADLFLEVQRYYEYMAEYFNIEIMYSESIDAAEDELAFIENCAAAGCQAIVGYYNIARDEAVQLAIDKGMYYYGVAEEDDLYDKFKDNDMYLGGYYNENMDYESGYAIGKGLVDAGSTKLVYASGGRDFGVKMFVDRSAGFYAAVEEAVANRQDVEVVYDVSGWPGTDAFSSEQTTALDMDIDGIASSFGSLVWLQPVANTGKDNIKFSAVDALSSSLYDVWDSGQMVVLSVETAGIFGMAVPIIVNAVDGNLIRNEKGQAPRVPVKRLVVTSSEDFRSYCDIESDGTWILNIADLQTLIVGLNPEFSYEQMGELYLAQSVEEVMARREAQGK